MSEFAMDPSLSQSGMAAKLVSDRPQEAGQIPIELERQQTAGGTSTSSTRHGSG